jgi:hypothetical protein
VVAAQLAVGVDDALLQAVRKGLFQNEFADFLAGARQRRHVVDVERVELGLDPLGKTVLGKEVAVSVRRGGKTARHLNAERQQMTDHFAERGVLASDQIDIVHAEGFEPT